jgi:Ca-activated chloride channel family protein
MHKYLVLFLTTALLWGCSLDESDEPGRYSDSTLINGVNGAGGPYINYDVTGEQYAEIIENPFIATAEEPTSTFSIDADGASYSNARRFLTDGIMPPPDALRTEELINYFDYDYPQPEGPDPIGLNGEVSRCPWAPAHKLVRIGIKGQTIEEEDIPPSNLVFLIDVSGSMGSARKLPLFQEAFKLLAQELTAEDRVAIVTYAGQAGVALPSTAGDQTETIINAIEGLTSGGSTAGADGINTAYEIALDNYIEEGNNRVILATDGDFNVGPSSTEELVQLIEEKREQGVFLTVLGFGTGNLNDQLMEQIANNGNGTYEYIDNQQQAEKVLVEELGKLYTVAKDVKVQVTFNTNLVEAYRLIGYENRLLDNEDFEDDEADGGEIGSGQAITALYEIRPAGGGGSSFGVPTFTIEFRYKDPTSDVSQLISLDIPDQSATFDQASEHMRFAAGVASFGLLMRDSEYKGQPSYDEIYNWCSGAMTYDPGGYRQELLELIEKANELSD